MNFWQNPIQAIGDWLTRLLLGLGLPDGLTTFLVMTVGVMALAMGSMLFVIFLIWYERKLLGRIQDRLGPNRVGPWGIFQPFADMAKIFLKEYITPLGADKVAYNLAPALAVGSVLMVMPVVPFTAQIFGVDLNVGVLYIIGVGALGELAIILAGYSSNNKYAMLGAFRVVAQLISYEVPLVLSLLIPVLLANSMGMNDIVKAQPVWFLLVVPLAALIFFIASTAEVGRAPFDLVEAESEIVAGFNIEYGGLKFGMFYVAEFLHAFTAALVFVTLFMGGWRGPGVEQFPLLGGFYLLVKTFIVHFVLVLFRGSLPRFRIDQMMDLNWKLLTPVALVLLIAVAISYKLLQNSGPWPLGLGLLAVNVLVGLGTLAALRVQARRKRVERKIVAPVDKHPIQNEALL